MLSLPLQTANPPRTEERLCVVYRLPVFSQVDQAAAPCGGVQIIFLNCGSLRGVGVAGDTVTVLGLFGYFDPRCSRWE